MTGCLAGAALQVIPEVAQLATGAGALGASAVHGDDKLDQQSDAPGAACNDIKASAPLVIELRTAASAPLSFRNLTLVTPHKKKPYWEAQGDWRAGSQGLSARDLAMQVALPVVDGRILSRAVSFKAEARFDPATQCAILSYQPVPDRIAFVADSKTDRARIEAELARADVVVSSTSAAG